MNTRNMLLSAGGLFAITLGFALSAAAGNAVNPEAIELMPMPRPAEFASDMDAPVRFDAGVKVGVDCPDAAAVDWLRSHFAEWYGETAPGAERTQAKVKPAGDSADAYAVVADEGGVTIAANALAGVRWAAYSLRQVAIAKRGTMTVAGHVLPKLRIVDSPHLKFRAVHLCWIPEIKPVQIERALRLAALLKFNYAIIEPWGMYRSARHPWWGWPDGTMTPERVRGLVALGKDIGITLIPQINVFGHGSIARSCSLKHAVLDLQPQYEPLFEPGGWNWCLTNPETQRVLRELIVEMHDLFGRPPYFHLGCDEAQPPTCPECRKRPYGELVCEHLTNLADFVRQRGAKAMLWHDMLIERGDPRWTGFTVCGTKTTATLADTLPKDVVICDWQYSNRKGKDLSKWPTTEYFIGKGFPVTCCPWENTLSMREHAAFTAKNGGFGIILTTWHHMRGAGWSKMFRFGSSAAWGTEPTPAATQYDTAFGNALRLVGHDMKISNPLDTGNSNYQVPPTWWIDN